ncbi:MAG: histidine--tRNA ligase [Deltaproteobacteria bacterium]|nr:histidine--tRNA ligase [Deltaproteobacteria bacterium]
MIQLIRGFKDILPGEVELWQFIEKQTTSLFENFGFRDIRIPIMERTELFSRSIGEETDIVEKEMYTFPDRKGDLLTLRPEATASIVRSYIQHRMYAADPVQKLYTIGPMFRRERPQKGRYRQFYQIDAEVFGVSSPLMDAQIMFMLMTLFTRLSVTDCTAKINSLGCPNCRPTFTAGLSKLLSEKAGDLCEDCSRRSARNPLRVLDCKVPACKAAMADAPSILDYLCPDCRGHFDSVMRHLTLLGVSFELDKRLVRGLDYYTRTAFEIQTTLLGAQSAIAGGGRYDGLVKALGGPDIPAIGFAIGVDRLAEIAAQSHLDLSRKPKVFIAALGEASQTLAFEWVSKLAEAGIHAEMDMAGRSLKSQMKQADRLGAGHVLIAGDAELEKGLVQLRDMATKDQVPVPVNGLVEAMKSRFA